MTGLTGLPPALGFGVGRHLGHVGFKILPNVFKVAEKIMRAIWHPSEINRKIPDLAVVDHSQNPRPRGSMQALVFVEFFRLHRDDASVSFHKLGLMGFCGGRRSGFRRLAFTD